MQNNKAEEEKKIKLTILCITYNHSKFVKQVLDSVLEQKTNFSFEVIVADDCSTDNTQEIIKEYAAKYPDIIKPVLRKKNLGPEQNAFPIYNAIETDYFMLLDGDDYFCDPLKLQKQVDILEANPDFSICCHQMRVFYDDNYKPDVIFPTKQECFNKNILDLNDLMKTNFVAINPMYRWRFSKDKDFYDIFPTNILPGDWYMHLLHAKKGKIYFIEEVMSCYRKHPSGIWFNYADNENNFLLTNGIKMLNFAINFHKVFANDSAEYYNIHVKPFFKNCFFQLFKHKDFEKLQQLAKMCPDECDEIIKDMEVNDNKILKSVKLEFFSIKQKNNVITTRFFGIPIKKEKIND